MIKVNRRLRRMIRRTLSSLSVDEVLYSNGSLMSMGCDLLLKGKSSKFAKENKKGRPKTEDRATNNEQRATSNEQRITTSNEAETRNQ
jgi:hypothetical protein